MSIQKKPLTLKEIEMRKGSPSDFPVHGVVGLYCRYTDSSPRYFLRWKKDGKTFKKFYPAHFSLSEVRKLAMVDRVHINSGKNPLLLDEEQKLKEKQKEEEELTKKLNQANTFKIASEQWINFEEENGRWRQDPKGIKNILIRLNKHIYPVIGDTPIREINSRMLADLLNPLYQRIPETARQCKTIIKHVFQFALVNPEFNLIDSPVSEGLLTLTASARKASPEADNYPALPFKEIPALVSALLKNQSSSSLAILFSVLTATRSKAVRLSTWDQIDMEKKIWTIPRENDKKKEKNRNRTICLSYQAIDLLRAIRHRFPISNYIFPSQVTLRALDENAFSVCIKKMHRTKLKQDGIGWVDPEILDDKGCPRMITQHGTARSSFETWALDNASGNNRRFLKETVEACLLHQPNDGFNGAYDRTKKIKDRFELVNAWGTYCLGKNKFSDFFPEYRR